MNQRETLYIDSDGALKIGGCDAIQLAKKYGTPLYVFDEAHIRNMMRVYKNTLEKYYSSNGIVLYASKAFSCMAIYAIAKAEGIGVDVVSGGELYTAKSSDFPMENVYMHGNNKTDAELNLAVEYGVGHVVIDCIEEAKTLNEIAKNKGIKQKVLIRINPGIEAHTHAYIQTAKTDSKFGFSVASGAAEAFTREVLNCNNLVLDGYHCHIGSQIFEKQSFVLAAEKMMNFLAQIKKNLGFNAKVINLGGGFGIWYTDEDPKLTLNDYEEYLKALIEQIKVKSSELNIPCPYLVIEPGRSIVGEAGITLYTVGTVKDIKDVRRYVAIDGGMGDNPRYALYQSKYTVLCASKANLEPTQKVTIAGKCCESGDLIAVDVPLPEVKRGDILAVLSTGAYNYSMASNYNRNTIPAAVLVNGGNSEIIIKRQDYDDILRNDVVPERLK